MKRLLFLFCSMLLVVSTSAQYYMNVFQKNGQQFHFYLADVDSINFTSQYDSTHVYPDDGINSIAKALRDNDSISLFYQAMVLTGMIDSIRGYIDESYVSYNAGDYFVAGGNSFRIQYKDKMYIMYTVFCETNSVLNDKAGISTIEQLIEYSKAVYDESFPEDANKYDSDFTDRRNPLNRFVSYHVLPMIVDLRFYSGKVVRFTNKNDVFEDYFSPMLQHSTLKVCTSFKNYAPNTTMLNGKGTDASGITVRGLYDSDYISSSNGIVYYLSDILTYSKQVRENVLDTRMRVLSSSMFPELMTNGSRQYEINDERTVISFNGQYKRSFRMSDNTQIYVPLLTRYGTYSYMDDDVYFSSRYDVSFKLPSVPVDGLYEIRLRLRADKHLYGGVQFYLNDKECRSLTEADVQWWDWNWISDSDFKDNWSEEEIDAFDDTLRVHSFMKDMDSYETNSGIILRDVSGCIRYIICTDEYMEANKDYYLRIKRPENIDDDSYFFRLNYLEIVPKKIYDGPVREDKH